MNYGTTESSAYFSRYYPTFSNMGYIGHTELQDFSEEDICSLLDKSENPNIIAKMGPVIMQGYQLTNGSISGHGWVIDGYIQYERYFPLYPGADNYIADDILFHCVWGWGGLSNGYFYWATNESLGGTPDKVDEDNNASVNYIYNIDLQYMGNFTPRLNNPINPNL